MWFIVQYSNRYIQNVEQHKNKKGKPKVLPAFSILKFFGVTEK
jgi:hypothetical protein